MGFVYSSNVSRVDSDSTKDQVFHLDVLDPSILDGKQSIYDVIIASSYVHVISHQLKQYGFVDESIATVPYNAFLISHGVSAKELFICLNEFNIRYVVMRNFATLPDAVPGDIDILIHDADIPRLADCPLIPISAYHKLENSLPSEDLPVKIDIYAACVLLDLDIKIFQYFLRLWLWKYFHLAYSILGDFIFHPPRTMHGLICTIFAILNQLILDCRFTLSNHLNHSGLHT